MKKSNVINTLLILGLVFLGRLSLAATQAQTLSAARENTAQQSQSGFYAGLEYVNLTDLRFDYKSEYWDGTQTISKKETSKGGTHVGMMGFSLGYQIKNPNEVPIRITTALRLMQSFNSSETEGNKMTLIIPEANIGYLWTDRFETFGGVSIPVVRGDRGISDYKSRGGLNLGMAAHLSSKITLAAAYNVYVFHLEASESNSSANADVYISGLALTAAARF